MRPADLIAFFPNLYHMAEPGTWPSIQEHGLLSTSALLDKFEINGEQRRQIESCHRPESIEIKHLAFGTAVIRDQKPMSESALQKCLQGFTPRQWYESLNRRVFFWLTWERLMGLLAARAYRHREHCVLTLDTVNLVERYREQITLSPINSGSTVYNPQARGAETFLSIDEYPFDAWARKRRTREKAVAELAVDYAVSDVTACVLRVEHRQGDSLLEVVWEA
jgi:hypothetical protein